MGGAQAIAALAYGTDTRRSRRRGRRARATSTCRRPSTSSRRRVGIDGFAGPSDLLVAARRPGRRARARAGGARHARPGRARRGQPSWPSRRPRAVCDALAARSRSCRRAPDGRRGGVCDRRGRRRARGASALANAFAPEHLQLIGAEMEALAPVDHAPPAACSWAPPARPRSATTSPAPTTSCRRAAPRASPRRSRRATFAARWPRCGSARGAAKLAAAGAPIARAEGFDVHAESMEARVRENPRAMSRTATIERTTAETDVRLTLALEGTGAGTRVTGVGFLDHMLDLLARHGRLDLDVTVSGDLQTGAHHTAEDTAIVLGQALDAALGDRVGHRPLRLGHRADGRGAGELRDRHLRTPVHAVRGGAAAGLHRRLRARADGGVLPRAGQRRQAHAAPARGGRHATRTT